jgi:hypothetical protein
LDDRRYTMVTAVGDRQEAARWAAQLAGQQLPIQLGDLLPGRGLLGAGGYGVSLSDSVAQRLLYQG